jgi:hypothetical protein
MKASLEAGVTSMQSFPKIRINLAFYAHSNPTLPIRTTGQDFLHSCLHFFGLHLSLLTIAIRVSLSVIFRDLDTKKYLDDAPVMVLKT